MAVKIAILVFGLVVAALLAFSIAFYRRPLAIMVWLRRNALRRAGLRKTKFATSVGQQTVWCGGSGPVLVLLHGAADQAGTWHKIIPALKTRFELVLPDLAGHGESEPRQGVLSVGTLLDALQQLLDAPPWRGKPLIFVGNSLGAWMTMLYANKHPQRVTRAMLVGGGPIKGVAELGLMPKNREEARRIMAAALDPSSPRPANFFLDDLIRVSNSGPMSRLMAAGVEDMSKYLLESELPNFQTPVDLIWGRSDGIVPLDYAKKLQSQLPNCTLTVIDRAGHAPQLERPHEFARVLLQVLTSPPASDEKPAVSIQPGGNA